MAIGDKVLDRLLSRMVRHGTLAVTYADGRSRTFGAPVEGFPEVALRFTDAKVPRDILLDPRLGVGEAYMDGRIEITRGDVMELVSLARSNNRWEDKASLAHPYRPRPRRGAGRAGCRAAPSHR